MSLSNFAVNAPVKVTMLFMAVLLLGYISLTRLPTSLFPDVRTPRVTTTIRTTGLSSSEVERRICEPLERALYTIRGVAEVKSIARADQAVVVAEFGWDTPLDFAFLDVKKAVSELQRDRQEDISSATVLRYDPNAVPIVTLAVSNPRLGSEELFRLAKNTLKPRMERLQGVANVVIAGGEDREVQVRLDEARLLRYGIDLAAVSSALSAENVNAPGGYVEEGARRYLLKAVGQFQSIEEVGEVVVSRNNGAPVFVRDLGTIEYRPRDAISAVYLDGEPAVGLSFFQEAQSNTVAVAKRIRDEVEVLKKILPEETRIIVANDQSSFITSALAEVRDNAIAGSVLSILILLATLRDFRTTIIISIAIPISIVATFNLMYFQGLSLNLMSLGGLALGVGLLVDNAVVVLENIYRLRQQGMDPMEASLKGAKEVSAAIIASTGTTIIVFLPIIYIEGVAALLFKEQALTVTYSVLASLLVALLLIPMLCSRFMGAPPKGLLVEETSAVPTDWYARLLVWSLERRGPLFLASVVLLAVSVWAGKDIPREFLPRTEQRQIGIRMVAPSGTPIDSTERLAESLLGTLDEFRPAVERTFVRVGEDEGAVNADTEDPNGPNTADFYISLADWENPTTETLEKNLGGLTSTRLAELLGPTLERFEQSGIKAQLKLSQGSLFDLLGESAAPLIVEIRGPEIDELSRAAAEIQRRLSDVPGIVNVRTNILAGSPEVLIRLDRVQLGRLGLDVRQTGELLRKRIEGDVATQIRREEGDVDLRVKVDYGQETLDTLRGITLRTSTGAIVPLASIARFEVVRGPREILRRGQDRIARVMADLDGVRLSEAIAAAQSRLGDYSVPRGYALNFTGEEESRVEAFAKLGFALLLSVVLVYMVMASIFESFIQPFLIMMTIPMALIGVVAAFVLLDQTLNVMAIIGIVMLGGIVVNNAIVLLDCVNQVRRDHPAMSTRDTLVIGCARRLRPVNMTTTTTLLGLLPLAMGIGDGAELREAMAIAVIGGLASSTVLTLVLIPIAQSYLDDAAAAVSRVAGRLRSRKTAAA
ncbi:MAG: efflux RND transporter permease subunit [Candidatus Sumerlaeia bacterium]|nr:efflux RND transporter permease subunit [Candidatus Sumerlaeia bacterium]